MYVSSTDFFVQSIVSLLLGRSQRKLFQLFVVVWGFVLLVFCFFVCYLFFGGVLCVCVWTGVLRQILEEHLNVTSIFMWEKC